MTSDLTADSLLSKKNFALFLTNEHGDEEKLNDIAGVEPADYFSITRFVTAESNLSSLISQGDATVVLRIYQSADLFHDFVYRLTLLVDVVTTLNTLAESPMILQYIYEYEFIEERKM